MIAPQLMRWTRFPPVFTTSRPHSPYVIIWKDFHIASNRIDFSWERNRNGTSPCAQMPSLSAHVMLERATRHAHISFWFGSLGGCLCCLSQISTWPSSTGYPVCFRRSIVKYEHSQNPEFQNPAVVGIWEKRVLYVALYQWPKKHFWVAKSGFWGEFSQVLGGSL